jgi:hypothetical protein
VRLRLATFVVALAVLPAAPAVAAPRPVYGFVPSEIEPYGSVIDNYYSWSSPVMAGDAVVWARSRAGGGWVVEQAPPGATGRVVATIVRPTGGSRVVQSVRVAGGSPTRVVWTDTATDVLNAHGMDYRTVRSSIFTSDAQGRTIFVTGCSEMGRPCECPPFCSNHTFPADLDGDVLAYVEGNYPDRRIVIDDLSSSAEPVRLDTGDRVGDRIRIAGDVIAYVSVFDHVVVYDWRARRELYRVPDYIVYDLQPDGKLVAVQDPGRIVWHSPAEPQAHRIEPPEGRRYLSARIAGDRILATHEIKFGRSRTLAVVGLDGRARDIAGADSGFFGLDFDGRRAAWSALSCGRVSMVLDPDVDETDPQPANSEPARPACVPPTIRGIGVGSRGQVVVKLVCGGGCSGRLRADADPALGAAAPLARRSLDLRPSDRVRRVELLPSRADRKRLLNRGSELRVQAVFAGSDRNKVAVGATRAGSVKRP